MTWIIRKYKLELLLKLEPYISIVNLQNDLSFVNFKGFKL